MSRKSETNLALISRLISESDGVSLNDISDGNLLNKSWGGLLGAAPEALCRMGQCYVVASIPKAALIELPSTTGLEYRHVRANLSHCADIGRDAFQEAELQMKRVQLSAKHICEPRGIIDQIVKALQNDCPNKSRVDKYMELLEKLSVKCKDGAQAIEGKFTTWQTKVNQIYRACEESEDDKKRELNEVEKQMSKAKIDEKHLKEERQQTSEKKAKADVELKNAQKEYEVASKKLTPGFKDFADEAAYSALDITKKALNTGLKGLDFALDVARDTYLGNTSRSPQNLNHDLPPALPVVEDLSRYNAALSDAVATRISRFETTLFPGSKLEFDINLTDNQSAMLDSLLDDLSLRVQQDPLASSSEGVGIRIKHTFECIIAIATEIKKSAAEAQTNPEMKLEAKLPEKWRSNLSKAAGDYNSLLAKRRMPVQHNRNNTRKLAALQSSGQSRLHMKYEKFQLRYQDKLNAENAQRQAEKEDREALQRIHETISKLKQLEGDELTLKEVKRILQQCVGHLSRLKGEVASLVTFFTDLHSFVTHIHESRRDEFGLYVDSGSAYTEEDMEDLKAKAIELRIYYAVAFELASTYTEVSQKHIMPGLNMLDQLNLTAGEGSAEARIENISKYTIDAKAKIKATADKRRYDLEDAFIDRRGEAEEVA